MLYQLRLAARVADVFWARCLRQCLQVGSSVIRAGFSGSSAGQSQQGKGASLDAAQDTRRGPW